MAASCNATPLVTFQNQVTVTRATASEPVATLDRSGSVDPRVINWQTADVDPPFAVLKARAARPAEVLGFDDVNYIDTLEDKGLYHTDVIYRQGNIVWLSNGSQWLYIAAAPGKGHNPPLPPLTADDYWQQMQPATTAGDITYADGTPVEDLKPAEPGATAGAPAGTPVAGRDASDVIQDLDTNAAAAINNALRQEDYQRVIDGRTFFEGQEIDSYFLTFRNQVNNGIQLINSILSLLGVKNQNATAFIMNLMTVQIDADGKTLAQKFDEVGAASSDLTVDVQQLMEAVINPDGTGYGKFVLRTTANGSIAGISGIADGQIGRLSFVANVFDFVDPNGANPINVFNYANGKLSAPQLYVKNLEADTVTTNHLVAGAAQETNYVILNSDTSIARGNTATVAGITFVKAEDSSVLKLMFFGMFSSPDDLQFNGAFVVDNTTSYAAGRVNVVLDSTNSLGSMPITPFLYLAGIPKGTHTVTFSVTNNEVDNLPLTVKAGSALEILELKKGVL